MTPTSTPRLNLGQIRAKIREFTGILSNDVFPDSRINALINETLFGIVKLGDNVANNYWDQDLGSNYGKRIRVNDPDPVTGAARYYYVPGWRFDNYLENNNGTVLLRDRLYLTADTDLAPWTGGYNYTGIGGYYDLILVYKVTADILKEINDDTTRSDFYYGKYKNILSDLIRDEFVEWNEITCHLIPTTSNNYFLNVIFRTLRLLGNQIGYDHAIHMNDRVVLTVWQYLSNFYFKYKWNFPLSGWGTFGFAYGLDTFLFEAAANIGAEVGVSKEVTDSWQALAEVSKQRMINELLRDTNVTTNTPDTLGTLRTKVIALLQDFSKDLPNHLIDSWINEAYNNLCMERNWKWLEQENTLYLPENSIGFNIDANGSTRLLNLYIVEFDGMVVGNVVAGHNIKQVTPVPHVNDRESSSSKWKYKVNIDGTVVISPAPTTEGMWIKYSYLENGGYLAYDNTQIPFLPQFGMILAYRAAMKGVMLHPQGKKLYEVYDLAQEEIHQAMVNYYVLNPNNETFSLGEDGLDSKRYLPSFKAV
jgi:hypothetical protein